MGWVSAPRPGRFTPGKEPVPIAYEAEDMLDGIKNVYNIL